MGLLVMVIFALYLLVCIIAILWGRKQARMRGYKGWQGGLLAAFIMYNLVFWDLIPVYAIHTYQCNNNAGFTVYKTLEQWKVENPGVAETLVSAVDSNRTQTKSTIQYQLNQRFIKRVHYEKIWHVVRKRDEMIIDLKTGEVIAEYIDFDGNPSQFISANIWNDYKFWLAGAESCERDMWPKKQIEFNGFTTNIEKLGSRK
jgi:hypothetical protein